MKIPEGIEDKHYDNFSLLFEFSALGLHQENKNLILQLSGIHIELKSSIWNAYEVQYGCHLVGELNFCFPDEGQGRKFEQE